MLAAAGAGRGFAGTSRACMRPPTRLRRARCSLRACGRCAADCSADLRVFNPADLADVQPSNLAGPPCLCTPPTDYVADLCVYPEGHALLSVSGDGTLAVIDLRKNRVGRCT